MSHFIIRENSVCIFGTPNGHARTQLLQAMQRGLRAVCTTPSPVRLIASAGQTSAQVGESQCMQTTGTVCTEIGPVNVLQMNHRMAAVRVAFAARGDARLAADAAVRIEEELEVHRSVAFAMRTAQTLYSGIFDTGSCAPIVS